MTQFSERLPRVSWLIALSLFVLAYTGALSAGSSFEDRLEKISANHKVGNSVTEALTDAVQDSRVSVIIAFDYSGGSSTKLNLRSPEGKSRIASVTDSLLSAMAPDEFELLARFRSINALAVDIGVAGLESVLRRPEVMRIDLDVGGRGHLAEAVPLVGIESLRDTSGLTGYGIKVAVIDTGLDTDHPDLAANIVDEACFADVCPDGPDRAEDNHGHGTNVAGVIASAGNVAPIGAAPDVSLVAVKAMDSNNEFSSSSIILNALDYVINDVPDLDIVNMSLGSWDLFSDDCDTAASWTIAYANAVSTLRANGVLSFASSGNESDTERMTAPACVSNVISVGAVWDTSLGNGVTSFCTDTEHETDLVTCFTNSSATTDIMAPGAPMTSTGNSGGTSTYYGTSQATPLVAGCAALVKQSSASLTPDQVENRLKTSSVMVSVPASGRSYPRLDCFEAVLGNNTLPVISITDPVNGAFILEDTLVNIAATATDAEDGDLSNAIEWSDNGTVFATGDVVTQSFSIGTHTLTASVTDSSGLTNVDAIEIDVVSQSADPEVTILTPANGASIIANQPTTLTASASDREDGDLTGIVQWADNGAVFATGESVSRSFSVGIHTIAAVATDSHGGVAEAEITINATAASSNDNEGGGGGGTFSWELILLILLITRRRWPRTACRL